MHSRRVTIALYPGFQPLDVTGPHSVFAGANDVLDAVNRSDPRYALELAAETTGPVVGDNGLAIVADHSIADMWVADLERPPDTVLVPGGNGARGTARLGGPLLDWLRLQPSAARRVTTVCSGTFIAAAAGWCVGRRVTTHWSRAGQLAEFCPECSVSPDAIYIRDGSLWTSAGVTAGIDLALALVEDDLGGEVAQIIARHLVVPLRRPGKQSQYATPVWSDAPTSGPIAAARDLIHASPADDHSVPSLARRTGVSERHFTRLFRTEVGESPAKYVERVRVDAARQLLDTERVGLEDIATRCGFGTTETLRRAFHRRLGCSPDDYRRQFRIDAAPTDPTPTPTG